MSKRLYPHKYVRYWDIYDIDDICAIFSDFDLHPQTVRKWVKNGLKTIDKGKKPLLVYGNDLIIYLKKRNDTNKCKTAFNEMYCMRCQDARLIFRNEIFAQHKLQFIKAQGVCRECKTRMFKNYKLTDISALRHKFKLIDVLELCDPEFTTSMTHMRAKEQCYKDESTQGELF